MPLSNPSGAAAAWALAALDAIAAKSKHAGASQVGWEREAMNKPYSLDLYGAGIYVCIHCDRQQVAT